MAEVIVDSIPLGSFLWSIMAVAIGLSLLIYVVVSIRRGWHALRSKGEPMRKIYMSGEPGEFWAGMILVILFAGIFGVMGICVLMHVIKP